MSRYSDEKREMISGGTLKLNFLSIFIEEAFSEVSERNVLNLLHCMEPRKALGLEIRGRRMNLVFRLDILKTFNLNKQITILWEVFIRFIDG